MAPVSPAKERAVIMHQRGAAEAKARGRRHAGRLAAAVLGLGLIGLLTDCAVRLPPDGAADREGVLCRAAMECPQPDSPCLLAYCMDQQCVQVPSPDGQLPEEAQRPGDCQQLSCDGNGQVVAYPAGYDEPADDGNPCTEERCQGTEAEHAPKPAGAPCGDGGVCNGAGTCGDCLPDAAECHGKGVRSCTAAGKWKSPTPCGPSEPVCRDAQCVPLVEVALGATHGCGRFEDGTVRCWGSGTDDRLGRAGLAAARPPSWGTGFRGTALGPRHGCALDRSGTTWCWGANDFGQLGNGSYEPSAGPTRVDVDPAAAVAVGRDHSCALTTSGRIYCWGRNDHGQLGNGKAPPAPLPASPGPSPGGAPTPRPTPIAGLAGATALELPGPLTCVRLGATPPRCWGATSFPLPPPSDDPDARQRVEKACQSSPVEVAGLPPSRQLVLGSDFGCALDRGGAVHCWGAGDSGQLGDGTRADRFEAAPVTGLTGVTTLAAGATFVCALRQTGSVHCWGGNDRGQLGNGTRDVAARPGAVAGLGGVRVLLAGDRFACAWPETDGLACWGAGESGQLGNGTTADALRPVPVAW